MFLPSSPLYFSGGLVKALDTVEDKLSNLPAGSLMGGFSYPENPIRLEMNPGVRWLSF